MRLTVELIQNSISYINPVKDRELDLRGALYTPAWKEQILHFWNELDWYHLCVLSRVGHKIPAIENLGIAKVSLFYSSIIGCSYTYSPLGPRCNRFYRQLHYLPRKFSLLPSPSDPPSRAESNQANPANTSLVGSPSDDAGFDIEQLDRIGGFGSFAEFGAVNTFDHTRQPRY